MPRALGIDQCGAGERPHAHQLANDSDGFEECGCQCGRQRVVVDAALVTSRGPDDLPAFCAKLIEEFSEGKNGEQVRKAHQSERQAGM